MTSELFADVLTGFLAFALYFSQSRFRWPNGKTPQNDRRLFSVRATVYSVHVYRAWMGSGEISVKLMAACSSLAPANPSCSSIQVATRFDSVATEHRIDVAEIWVIFSKRFNAAVLGWCMLGDCKGIEIVRCGMFFLFWMFWKLTSPLYGSGSAQRHWCNSPFVDTPINSEYKHAICVKRIGVSFSGHASNSSEIQSGGPDDVSFFFVSIEILNVHLILCSILCGKILRLSLHGKWK